MPLEINQKYSITHKLKPYLKIRTAAILELNENEYASLAARIESSPLFEKLFREYGVLSIKKRSDAWLSGKFYSFIENTNPDNRHPEIDSIITENKTTVALIRKIGIEKFERNFINNEKGFDFELLSEDCGINKEQASQIIKLINTIGVYGEFFFPSSIQCGASKRYYKIAQIEKHNDACQIHFFLPHYVRGKYLIDHPGLKSLKNSLNFSDDQLKEIDKLIADIEAVNNKKNIVYEAVKFILKKQSRYFIAEKDEDLIFCTQKEAAREIGVEESSLSRALDGRSLETPGGSEKALAYFFQSRKKVGIRLVESLIRQSPRELTDAEIRKMLQDIYQINVSRRTVNLYRKSGYG